MILGQPQKTPQQRIAELEGTIADALSAMDSGLYGDARRILTKGKADTAKPGTNVIAMNGGAA